MKRILMLFTMLSLLIPVIAQDNCLAFFPNDPGTTLVNKTYNATGELLYTMTYKIDHAYDYQSGNDVQIEFVLTDSKNNPIDRGYLDAYCNDGVFFLKMTNRTMSPEIMGILGMDTELVGDFLDYPDLFGSAISPYDNGAFSMDAGEFTVKSKIDKKELVRTRVFNREYLKNEKITTPAGVFDASKISFDFEVTKDKETTRYKGTEWYAIGAGIVRSETHDKNNKLINYTELTSINKK